MKILLSLIILFIPFSILAKQICLAPSGCKIEMDTGFCPKCVEVDDEQPIIKEEKVVVVHKPIVKIPTKKKPSQLDGAIQICFARIEKGKNRIIIDNKIFIFSSVSCFSVLSS